MKIAILGRTGLLFKTMNLLAKRGHTIVLVGTCKAAPEYEVTEADFERYAKENDIPFFCNANLRDGAVAAMLWDSQADVAISVNWMNIIVEESIKCFKYGILNAHAGDLPRYRGNACPNWAMILGEKQLAVSVHFMEANKLDSGDILVKKYLPISEHTKIGEIYTWLGEVIPSMFAEAVSGLEAGTIIPKKQSQDRNTWLRVYPRKPSDSLIDWSKGAVVIERLINASSEPFSGAYTYYGMKKVIVWRAHAGEWDCPSVAVHGSVIKRDAASGAVAIACGDGVIWLDEIALEGKRQRPYDVIKSMRDRLGMNIEDEIYRVNCRLARLEQQMNLEIGVE